jgi:pimeloyl-ACP methyl ester carboxylesterase
MWLRTCRTPSTFATRFAISAALYGIVTLPVSVTTPLSTAACKLSKQWPEPQRFPQFLDKFGKLMSEHYDWSADIAKLPMPVLLVFADNDSVSQKQIAEFYALLGGSVKEPGWVNTQLSKSRLAVVPGYSHYNFITSPEVPEIIGKFVADTLTNPSTGAAAASQADSDLGKP